MQRVQTRDLGDDDVGQPRRLDRRRRSPSRRSGRWRSTSRCRPRRAPATLAGGVKLKGHPRCQGQGPADRPRRWPRATWATSPCPGCSATTRAVSQPFVVRRRPAAADPGLSVLELTDVQRPRGRHARGAAAARGARAAGRGRARAAGRLRRRVLPARWAASCGRSGGGDRDRPRPAPRPPRADRCASRSAAWRLDQDLLPEGDQQECSGRDFPYPILGRRRRGADDEDRRPPSPTRRRSRDRVAKAERILLFVHGIIGDTPSMAPSVQRARVGRRTRPLDVAVRPGPDLRLREPEHADRGRSPARSRRGWRPSAWGGPRQDAGHRGPLDGRPGLALVHRARGGQQGRPQAGDARARPTAARPGRACTTGRPARSGARPERPDDGRLARGGRRLAWWPCIERIDVTLDQMQPGSPFLKELTQEPRPGHPLRHARRQHVADPGGGHGRRPRADCRPSGGCWPGC